VRREELERAHLVARLADGVRTVEDGNPLQRELIDHREAVRAHRLRNAGNDRVIAVQPTRSVQEVSPAAIQMQSHLERIDDPYPVPARAPRLHQTTCGADAGGAGEDAETQAGSLVTDAKTPLQPMPQKWPEDRGVRQQTRAGM